ncbi:N-terminal C2 in EEIG1 and EHBP1 proteins-domain-containing protein [Rhodofomes roseus]|uniref:N-terminal C2 in EEIG1 and EHBP1 proteins-domain-containing protein n=1 Tax=Rhodofomes roseus TaxID=34475 RepID=A0ABQ8KB35_9APHY|nr:N-terminal C2 in EEIG1 and EHBP1 proteins-domain-containing protein [Rhodofomes roseus]KAH9834725.1 N-terminal C2 in EEIG1 and EHBP1 proteins-domain-containing protein [Rhodofomes roseus]
MKSSPTTTTPSAASTSSESTSDFQQHALGHGLLNQFGQFIPKHALFQVNVEIDQLSNVPLINGQFAVRWKFKNAQTRSGLISRMRGNPSWSSKGRNSAKGKGRASELGLAIEVTPADEDDEEGNESSPQDEGTEDEMYRHASGSSLDLLTPYTPDTAMPPTTPATATPADMRKTASAASVTSTTTTAVARGITPFQPLQNYNVKWGHQVNVAVQMDVHRETGDLLPNEVKLVVMQRVVPGDPDAPKQPRLGAVYLNLAEYADAGPVTRRYLLRESKTNATLKLTITLEHIGGTKNYRPPPLRKGEILASVTGLLANNDLMRTSIARQLDDFTHATHPGLQTFMQADGRADGDGLASASGLRATEDLIETLFNPLPSASPAPSPFTYFAPAAARQHSVGSIGSVDSQSDSYSVARSSTRSGSSDGMHVDVSVEKLAADSTVDLHPLESPRDAKGAWWKVRTRPGTPLGRHFKLPSPLPQRHTESIHA